MHVQSRFVDWNRWPARLLLILTLLLSLYGVLSLAPPPPPPVSGSTALAPNDGDPGLYSAIVSRMIAGQGYYLAAAMEQRIRGYPLKPFVTMRMPTLAYVTVALGGVGPAGIAMKVLALAALAAFLFAIRKDLETLGGFLLVSAVACGAMLIILSAGMQLWHESWAALLIMLSLALDRLGSWKIALLSAVVACLVREIASPFLIVMASAAALEGKRGQAATWFLALAPVGLALALHSTQVHQVVVPGDIVSPGWSGLLGWPLVVEMAATSTSLVVFGPSVAAITLPFAILGWLGWKSPLAMRAGLYATGMICAFALFARGQNMYWMILLAPLLPVGLALAGAAIRDIFRSAFR